MGTHFEYMQTNETFILLSFLAYVIHEGKERSDPF